MRSVAVACLAAACAGSSGQPPPRPEPRTLDEKLERLVELHEDIASIADKYKADCPRMTETLRAYWGKNAHVFDVANELPPDEDAAARLRPEVRERWQASLVKLHHGIKGCPDAIEAFRALSAETARRRKTPPPAAPPDDYSIERRVALFEALARTVADPAGDCAALEAAMRAFEPPAFTPTEAHLPDGEIRSRRLVETYDQRWLTALFAMHAAFDPCPAARDVLTERGMPLPRPQPR